MLVTASTRATLTSSSPSRGGSLAPIGPWWKPRVGGPSVGPPGGSGHYPTESLWRDGWLLARARDRGQMLRRPQLGPRSSAVDSPRDGGGRNLVMVVLDSLR